MESSKILFDLDLYSRLFGCICKLARWFIEPLGGPAVQVQLGAGQETKGVADERGRQIGRWRDKRVVRRKLPECRLVEPPEVGRRLLFRARSQNTLLDLFNG